MIVGEDRLDFAISPSFARPLVLDPRRVAVAIMSEEHIVRVSPDDGRCDPLNVMPLAVRRLPGDPSLMVMFDRSLSLPPLRRRALLHPAGWLLGMLRGEPVDGIAFWASAPAELIEALQAIGVRRTAAPAIWAWERRGQLPPGDLGPSGS